MGLEAQDAARSIAVEALENAKTSLGERHPSVADALLVLARIHDKHKEHQKAVDLNVEALGIYEASYGPWSLACAATHNNLAMNLVKVGQMDEAERHFRQALAIRSQIQSAHHPDAVAVRGNIAGMLLLRGKAAEALIELDAIIASLIEVQGPDAPSFCTH